MSDENTPQKLFLKFHKLNPEAKIPRFSTEGAACFDFVYPGSEKHSGYNLLNQIFEREGSRIIVVPGDRIAVPTGLIADIPNGYSIRIHPRSGLSLKEGLVLANQEAVIDSDYVDEIFILVYNISGRKLFIEPGTRIAQGELVKSLSREYEIVDSAGDKAPARKTSRKGGLGSTGK